MAIGNPERLPSPSLSNCLSGLSPKNTGPQIQNPFENQPTLRKDSDEYLAKVERQEGLVAFAKSVEDAVSERINLVEMMMDYHLEKVVN